VRRDSALSKVWPYEESFEYRDSTEWADVYCAVKPFYPMRNGDNVLGGTKSWVRLTIYEDRRTRSRYPHVNVDSDLTKLLRARVQEYTDGTCLFLVDYASGRFARLAGVDADKEGLYNGDVPIPAELDADIKAGYPVKPNI
jgi:hypothetical protein